MQKLLKYKSYSWYLFTKKRRCNCAWKQSIDQTRLVQLWPSLWLSSKGLLQPCPASSIQHCDLYTLAEKTRQEERVSLYLTWTLAETAIIESAISWSLREEDIWLSPVKMWCCTIRTVLCLVTSCSSEVDSVQLKPAVSGCRPDAWSYSCRCGLKGYGNLRDLGLISGQNTNRCKCTFLGRFNPAAHGPSGQTTGSYKHRNIQKSV